MDWRVVAKIIAPHAFRPDGTCEYAYVDDFHRALDKANEIVAYAKSLSAPTGEDWTLIRKLQVAAEMEEPPLDALWRQAADRLLSVLLGGGGRSSRDHDPTTCSALEQFTAGDDGWCEWTHPSPGQRGYFVMGCCDCGLRHDVEFQLAPNVEAATQWPGEGKTFVVWRMRRSEDQSSAKPAVGDKSRDDLPPQNPTGGEPG